MRPRAPLSLLVFAGLLAAGSTALGYYYYYVYSPPLAVAELFMSAMESRDREALADIVLISVSLDGDQLRPPLDEEIDRLLEPPFERGRVLDQRTRAGPNRTYHYLVYREPDGQIYALVVAEEAGRRHVVVPSVPMSERKWFLWDYAWTN